MSFVRLERLLEQIVKNTERKAETGIMANTIKMKHLINAETITPPTSFYWQLLSGTIFHDIGDGVASWVEVDNGTVKRFVSGRVEAGAVSGFYPLDLAGQIVYIMPGETLTFSTGVAGYVDVSLHEKPL